MPDLTDFKDKVAPVERATLRAQVTAARGGDTAAREQVAAALVWAAFACPDATPAVYDNLASAWLGRGDSPDIDCNLPMAPLNDGFWTEFAAVVDGAHEGYDATGITTRVAALGGVVDESFGEIAEQHARNHPGAKASLVNPIPGMTDIDMLGCCPPDSLGKTLHSMIVENGYDLEVLDREAIKLSELPPSLAYLNTRILQMHDVWHLVAGYRTTATHEIAISAFQLAQFGHNYSAMFLATVTSISIFVEPRGFSMLMQLISEAWQHGRATPPMMDIEWEQEWDKSLPEIRHEHAIPTYSSVLPDTLMEVAAGDIGGWERWRVAFRVLFLRFRGALPA